MTELCCKKCGKKFNGIEEQKEIELHHIIPKCVGGTDKDGRIYLCGKCHNIIIHSVILKQAWDFVEDKELCKDFIKKATKGWCENYDS